MVSIISLFFWNAVVLITLNACLCEEDIESVRVVKEDLPPETWDNEDYRNWEIQETKDQDEINEDTTENNDNEWQFHEEQDGILYDLYEKQPERIPEIDEDGLALSDSWTILDFEEEDDALQDSQDTFLSHEDISKDGSIPESSTVLSEALYSELDNTYHQVDNRDCDETEIEKKTKRIKVSPRKRNDDEFYFKHKTYAKKASAKGSTAAKLPNWKQNCCIRGKRVGNGRRTFLSKNIFQECKMRTSSLASRMSRSCKWIFWSCCEARALRRYYIYSQSSQKKIC